MTQVEIQPQNRSPEGEVTPKAVSDLAGAAGIESAEEKPAWQTIIEAAKAKIAGERDKLPEKPKKKADKKRAEELDFAETELGSYSTYFERQPQIERVLTKVEAEIKKAEGFYNQALEANDSIATQQALARIEDLQRRKETVLAYFPKSLREGQVTGEWSDGTKAILQEAVDKLRPLVEAPSISQELTPEQLLEKGKRVLEEFQRIYDEAANRGEELAEPGKILKEILDREGLTEEQYGQYLDKQGEAIQQKWDENKGDITKLTPFERRFWWQQIAAANEDDIKANLEKVSDASIWSDEEVKALYEALPEWVRNQDEYAPLRERKERIDLLECRDQWTPEQIIRAQQLGIELTGEEKAKLEPPPPPEFTQELFKQKLADFSLTTEELKTAIENGWCDPRELTAEQMRELQEHGVDLEAAGAWIPAVRPTEAAVEETLEKLLERYAPSETKEGKGKVRGAVLPILAGFLGSRLGTSLVSALRIVERYPVPAVAAIAAFASSSLTSVARRILGENAFSLFARYSHTEGGKGKILGKVVKVGQLFTRGAERAYLRSAIGLRGVPKEFRGLFNEQGELVIPEDLARSSAEGVITEGIWYLLSTEAVDRLGAYLTDKEKEEIEEWKPKIREATAALLEKFVPEEERDEFLEKAYNEAVKKEKATYILGAGGMAGIGAAKAALLSGALTYLAERFFGAGRIGAPTERRVEAVEPPVGKKFIEEDLKEIEEMKRIIREGRPETAGIPEVPSQALKIFKSVGHTLERAGLPRDWGNHSRWLELLLKNDTENPELWRTASSIAGAIVKNPEGTLRGLSPETSAQALRAARVAIEALNKAGYNPATGMLDPDKARLLSLEEIKAVFHWVKEGATLYA